MKRTKRRRSVLVESSAFESLESRRLFAVTWGDAAKIMEQDVAANTYPTITGKGVTVAVMDTGIDYTAAALGGGFGAGFKVKGGHDFVDNDNDPKDTFGHGANVAGIIAGNGQDINGVHYQGIAPEASLVALRVSADGTTVTSDTILKALQWIETNYQSMGISIVNFSFGGGSYSSLQTDPTVSPEYKKLKDLGITFFSPTGNGGTGAGETAEWPAADPSVFGVGSVATNGSISSFTQRSNMLDLLAPGESLGTVNIGGGFGMVSLSSFASPVAAGAAALLKLVDPRLKPDDILSNFRGSGVRVNDNSFSDHLIFPRLDLLNSVTVAFQRAPDLNSDVGASGAFGTDLAFDKEGVLHFAYYNAATHNIRYATRSTTGFWSATRAIDTTGHDVGSGLSIALDPLGKPSIAYYDATLADLEYARFDGIKWRTSTIDSKNTVGQFPSLAFDSSGNPVVGYYRKTSGDLRVMRSDGTTWTRTEPDTTGDVGQFASLGVSRNGTIGVSYADTTNGDLKYAQWNGSAWTTEMVDNLQGAAFTSVAFNASNQPAISYYDAFNADLKYAAKSSGSWATDTISRKGAVGQYTNLWFDDANTANILYFSRKANATFRVAGTIGSWTADTVRLTGGPYLSAAPTADGSAAAYAYFDTVKLKLLTGDLL
jgi:hypothetical protein